MSFNMGTKDEITEQRNQISFYRIIWLVFIGLFG